MELKPNMYVRTKYGDVFILDKTEGNCLIPRDVYIPCIITEEDVTKASHNIEELLQIGDYVNGYMITDFDTDYYDEELDEDIEGFSIVLGNEEQLFRIPPKDIKTVLTKEQFEAMQYKVVEEC